MAKPTGLSNYHTNKRTKQSKVYIAVGGKCDTAANSQVSSEIQKVRH